MASLSNLVSILFRVFAYTFLRWIPGRQATYPVPILFLLSLIFFYTNKPSSITAQVEDSDSDVDLSIESIEVDLATAVDSKSISGVVTTPKKRKNKKKPSSPSTVVVSDEIETKKTITYRQPRVSIFALLTSFITGSPSSSSNLNSVTILLNTLLLFAVLDSLWTPLLFRDFEHASFHRVGSVTHDSVKIHARAPPLLPVLERAGLEAGARVAYRVTQPVGPWKQAGAFTMTNESDWNGVLQIDDLSASSQYEYRLLLPSSATHHPSFPTARTFTTLSDPSLFDANLAITGDATHYKFVSSSCVRPNFPYEGPLAHSKIIGAKYLVSAIEQSRESGNTPIDFMLFLGDMIYADVPHWMGSTVTAYFKHYRALFASPDWASIYEKIPVLSILDDHEIINDFSGGDDILEPANKAFATYLGQGNPTPRFKTVPEATVNYFDYRVGDSAFFVLDTRSYRSENAMADGENKSMLGPTQKAVLLRWIEQVNSTVTWKFIASSVPMMAMWSYGDDTWAGFLHEREELLDILQHVPNVIILSGDRHEFAAASLRETVTEFSTSPLSQFYLPIRTVSQNNAHARGVDDLLLKYLPDGNSKFTTFEVDNRARESPVVRVKVFIDGQEAWSVNVLGTQMPITELPKTVGSLGLSLLELLGFTRRGWF